MAAITGGLIAAAAAVGTAAKMGSDRKKTKEAKAKAAASQAQAAAAQAETASLQKAEEQRKSLLRARTETIQTSPLGVAGSIDTTKKKTLLGQ